MWTFPTVGVGVGVGAGTIKDLHGKESRVSNAGVVRGNLKKG